MSGGAFNYLHRRARDGEFAPHDLEYLDRCAEIAWELKNREFVDALTALRREFERLQELYSDMSDVLQAMEWRESGDTGDECILAELKKWSDAKRAGEQSEDAL